MAKFCGKCGSKLDEATGLCPNCDAGKPEENSIKKEEAVQKLTIGRRVRKIFLKLFLLLALLAVAAGGVLVALTYYGVTDIAAVNELLTLAGFKDAAEESDDSENMQEAYRAPAPDADSYYENNSIVVSEGNAEDSEEAYTESEAFDVLTERGFAEYSIITEYSMDGTYYEAVGISDTSSEKHPVYQTYYVTENSELWTIFLINGEVMANPVSYNVQSGLEVQVIISEANTVTSYDSTANKFYKTIPDESALIVIPVDKIDAETLTQLTIGVIDGYVE